MSPTCARIDGTSPLALLKVLGDDTRYAIYRELVLSPRPLSTVELSATVGLHPNTVRPHLDKMREVGLVEVRTDDGGEERRRVGRPRHRYQVAAGAPALGLEPPASTTLARMVLVLADRLGASADDAVAVGRVEGHARADAVDRDAASVGEALVVDQDRLGFGPAASVVPGGDTVVTFERCPFDELAEEHPDLVCGLHRGLVDGFVGSFGATTLTEFRPRSDRAPCRATLR